MKFILKILKCTLLYILALVTINLIFCSIYYFNGTIDINSFSRTLFLSLSDQLENYFIEDDNNHFLILLTIHHLLELICSAVLTGYIFAYIFNRAPRIIFPKKLLIRRRTSEGSENLLTLGVMIGNKSRRIYDVKCTVRFTYVKEKKPYVLKNSEVELESSIKSLSNYHRFSFKLSKVPKKLLKDFLSKESVDYNEAVINIIISGHNNTSGGNFILAHAYKLTDIIIDKHVPNPKRSFPAFAKKYKYERIYWPDVFRYEEVSEEERREIINEIQGYTEDLN